MTDVYQADRERILGITRGAEVSQRVQQDAQLRAAIAIEQEARAAAQAQAQARAAEAQMIAQAEGAAVEILRDLIPLYAESEEAALNAIEPNECLARTVQEIRAGLNEANRPLLQIEPLIEPSTRSAWRESLRDRAGLPKHLYALHGVVLDSDAKRIAATAIAAISAGIIGPGWIQIGRESVNFDF